MEFAPLSFLSPFTFGYFGDFQKIMHFICVGSRVWPDFFCRMPNIRPDYPACLTGHCRISGFFLPDIRPNYSCIISNLCWTFPYRNVFKSQKVLGFSNGATVHVYLESKERNIEISVQLSKLILAISEAMRFVFSIKDSVI